jgi:hypothetical protein
MFRIAGFGVRFSGDVRAERSMHHLPRSGRLSPLYDKALLAAALYCIALLGLLRTSPWKPSRQVNALGAMRQ